MLNTLRALPVFNRCDLTKSVLLSVGEGICMGLPYALFINIVQQLLHPVPDTAIIQLSVAAMTVILAIRVWITRLAMEHTGMMTYNTCASLREKLASHFFRVPMGFFQQHDSGQLSHSMNKDVEFTESIFSHYFSQFVAAVSLFGLITVLLFCYDWRLAASMLVGVPPAVVMQAWLKRRGNKLSGEYLDCLGQTNHAIMDWILGIREQRISGYGEKQFAKLQTQITHARTTSIKHELAVGMIPMLFIILSEAGFMLFLLIGLHLYFTNEVELAVFLVFIIASARIYRTLSQLAMTMAESRFMEQAAVRLSALLSTTELKTEERHVSLSGLIAVSNLSFRYPVISDRTPAQHKVLNNISFSARPGTLTAIVGPSGSGKSTLLHLLARYWEAEHGQISFDGTPISALSDTSLYQQLALVSQEIYLIDDTVMNNLRLARADASNEEIITACQQAQCHEFISQLPQGYDTPIGESGGALSGGERQRLALARALLSQAKIILLDEISSALDVQNEHALMGLFDQLKQCTTLIMIAHRESMVTNADNILFLSDGTILQQGQHAELLASSKDYRQLWQSQ